MKKIKVCFVGLGSIAKRHILNLTEIFKERGTEFQIDAYRSDKRKQTKEEVEELGISQCYFGLEKVPNDYDIIFITNPTRLHFETLQSFKEKGKHFFIEKPVFDEENIDISNLNLDSSKVYYVACPLRYTNVIQYLKHNIDFEDVYSIRCISSSYLPEWRPEMDYRNSYSARKELGGGVSIDLIHEWDYLQYLIGFPQKVFSIIQKVSNLEIDSDDIAIYIAQYPNMLVELHLDYFGRMPVRKIELYTKEETIVADLIHSQIRFERANQVIDFYEERNDYQKKELQAFLDIIKGKTENSNSIEKACKTLKLTKGEVS